MWEKALETSDPICQGKVVNLIENMEYQFRVIAVNKAGNSEPSDPTKTIVTKARFRKFLIRFFVDNLKKKKPVLKFSASQNRSSQYARFDVDRQFDAQVRCWNCG